MNGTFLSCYSLTTAPVIPNSVTSMEIAFAGCLALTGNIEINTSPTSYADCFLTTENFITITGSCSNKAQLAATANNGNVTYE